MDRLGSRHRRRATTHPLAGPLAALALTLTTPGVADAPTPPLRPLACSDFRSDDDAREWFRAHRTLTVLNPRGIDRDRDGQAC